MNFSKDLNGLGWWIFGQWLGQWNLDNGLGQRNLDNGLGFRGYCIQLNLSNWAINVIIGLDFLRLVFGRIGFF